MKKSYLISSVVFIILIAAGIFFYAKNNPSKTPIANFAECAAAGYPVAESYPRQCRADGKTFIEVIEPTLCTGERPEVCAEIYDPVCAKVNIQCIKAPCNPINETFPNACRACANNLVDSYVAGECMQK